MYDAAPAPKSSTSPLQNSWPSTAPGAGAGAQPGALPAAAGLNPAETKDLNQLIVSLKEDYNVSVLLIEHDMSLVMDISDRITVINQGRPLAAGTPDEVRQNDDVIKAYLGEA